MSVPLVPPRVQELLVPGEEVLWVGKPAIRPIVGKALFVPIVLAGTLILQGIGRPDGSPLNSTLWIFAVAVALAIAKLGFDLFRRGNAWQAFTNMRVLLPSGWDHAGIKPVNYGDIREIKEEAIGFGQGNQGIGIWTHGHDLRRIFPRIVIPGRDEHQTVFRVLRRTWLIATGELPPSAMEWEPRL
ncbi:hypothetical protein [Luteolibacter sp. LG18]|uniref:hypothetical protein n=1 Tax=Luteolibacter sp. LG18 TaxID=2819286 RepID=UPI002B2CB499|nr:hypothetical protein llg_31420 [Luteolibacter sp. LG18]